jgi:hypothetical protein
MPTRRSTLRRVASTATLTLLGLLLAGGVAAAGVGAAVVLGRTNTADHGTTLVNTAGIPLALRAPATAPPLAVSSATKVSRLNADLIDGIDGSALQRRITGYCSPGTSVSTVSAAGGLVCAREPFSVIWQIAVTAAGDVGAAHDGASAVRNAPGDYSVVWVGFPGRATPYCTGLGRVPTLVSVQAREDGTGNARLSFSGADTAFSCALIATG